MSPLKSLRLVRKINDDKEKGKEGRKEEKDVDKGA